MTAADLRDPGPQPELTGAGLRLRPWRDEDADDLGDLVDAEVTRRLGLPVPPWPPGALAEQITLWRSGWLSRGRAAFVVEVDAGVAGWVEVRFADGGYRGELSWVVLPAARGAGVARRAVEVLLRWAFSRGLERAEAWVEPDNSASLRVATAVGLRREGLARNRQVVAGRARDLVLLSRLREDVDPMRDPLPTIASSFPRIAMAAGVVVRDTGGRVLLLHTTYKDAWEVPGGIVERGEDVIAAAARECREEVGLDLALGSLLCLDRADGDHRSPDLVAALLDGGTHPPDLLRDLSFGDGEILAAHWCDRAEVSDRAGSRLARRLLCVLDAFDAGTLPGPTLVLRDGRPSAVR